MNALAPIGRLAPMQWSLDTAINVVLFAGLGGACAGLEDAGLPVHVANNHDPVALAAHAALFPHTRHTWATWQYCLHGDLLALQRDGGWSNITMVTRYAKKMPDAYREAVDNWLKET